MKTEGRQVILAAPEIVWSLITDPSTLMRILPGCESLEATSTSEFNVTLRLRVGALVDQFAGKLAMLELTRAKGFRFEAEGAAPSGQIRAYGNVQLQPDGFGRCEVVYAAELAVDGAIASVSPRLQRTTSRAFARRCLESLQKQADLRTRVYTTTVTAEVPEQQPEPLFTPFWPARLRQIISLLVVLTTAYLLWRGLWRRRSARLARDYAGAVTEQLTESNGS